jgi:hypothetical protein
MELERIAYDLGLRIEPGSLEYPSHLIFACIKKAIREGKLDADGNPVQKEKTND